MSPGKKLSPSERSEEHATDEREPSQSLSVVRAGSGNLMPVTAEFPARRIIALTTERPLGDDTVLPELVFLTSDAPVSPELGIENALANPATALFRMSGGALIENEASVAGELFLQQMTSMIAAARKALEYCRPDTQSREERIQARQLVDVLGRWVRISMLDRACGLTDRPLKIPRIIHERAVELGRMGNRLRHAWGEHLAADESPRGPSDSSGWDTWISKAMDALAEEPNGLLVSEIQRRLLPLRFPDSKRARERLSRVLRGEEPWPGRSRRVVLARTETRRLVAVKDWSQRLADVAATDVGGPPADASPF